MGTASRGAAPVVFTKTVATGTSTVILAAPSDGAPRINNGLLLKNLSTNAAIIYIGPSGVTTSNGYPLAVGESIFLAVDDASRIYAISGTASQDLRGMYM